MKMPTPAEFRKETIWHVDTHIDPAEKMGAPKFDGFLIVFFLIKMLNIGSIQPSFRHTYVDLAENSG